MQDVDNAGAFIEERSDDAICKWLIHWLRDCRAGRSGHPVLPRHLYLLVQRARNDEIHELIRGFLD
jgi:hypothetical protein